MPLPSLIAFAGYAGTGKDAAARCLISRGYTRHNFGDVIKSQVDALVRRHFGFSAFTEDRDQKARIRRTLESWGEDNYRAICDQFFDTLPDRAVNTRLVRCAEAERWKARGGVIVCVYRPGWPAATEWEVLRLMELASGGHLDATITNDGSIDELHSKTLATLEGLKHAA